MSAKVLSMIAVLAIWSTTAVAQHYTQTNLVSDLPGAVQPLDPNLVNAWGLARGATSPWWVNENGSGTSELFNGQGVQVPLTVIVAPPPSTPGATSAPTGIVFNIVFPADAASFTVTNTTNGNSGSSIFIFATEDGTISGWNPNADATHSIVEVDHSVSAVYKGLAIALNDGQPLLYAANFTGGKVEVFDKNWAPVTPSGGFVDSALPAGYGPFNVQAIGGNIFVSFAKQSGGNDEVHGKGLGFVDKFDVNGTFLMRLQHGPWFDAPWGLAQSPTNFGHFSNNILVGNFGSGRIAAFDPGSGEFRGFLHGARGPLVIDGLWAIAFGGGAPNNGATNTLFFTAGPDDESHGLFGTLTAIVHP